ncbi:hypothetical protein, partial [Yoonia sp.]|uniref:hypothetical protein n=1 Tax=Yoonia sp. TaxID=2212373 RepID=UPI00239E75E4
PKQHMRSVKYVTEILTMALSPSQAILRCFAKSKRSGENAVQALAFTALVVGIQPGQAIHRGGSVLALSDKNILPWLSCGFGLVF